MWSFYDPTGNGLELMLCRPPSMFRCQTRAQKFESWPTLVQCTCCLRLGHSVGRCPKHSLTIVCPLCRGPHTLAGHTHRCSMATRHLNKTCDCPVTCFLCCEKGKDGAWHGALSDSCPLKGAYHISRPPPRSSPMASTTRIDDVPSDAVTIPPMPITEDTIMETDLMILASITSPSAIPAASPLNA
jgi:hypothetical protein